MTNLMCINFTFVSLVFTFPGKLLIIYFLSSSEILGCTSGESATKMYHKIVQLITINPHTKNAHNQPKLSITEPKSGHVNMEPKEPPSKAPTNFPFSSGGAHLATKQCKLGKTTPYKNKCHAYNKNNDLS